MIETNQESFPSMEQFIQSLNSASDPIPDFIFSRIQTSLVHPLEDFLSRPSKKIRAQLVHLGAKLSQNDTHETAPSQVQATAQMIEWIHAGALIIDDIQDDSSHRRTQPSLHRKLGIPKALNAGNWLYFLALHRLKEIGLSESQQLQAFRLCSEALSKGHVGQSLDLGISIDTLPLQQILPLCLTSIELKSGVLVSLALQLGGVLGGASLETLGHLNQLGLQLGCALQAFDDLGNFSMKTHSKSSSLFGKDYEDLTLKRPSWTWAIAASEYSETDFQAFLAAIEQLPHPQALQNWAQERRFHQKAKEKASVLFIAKALDQAEEKWGKSHPLAFNHLKNLTLELEQAYDP